MKLFTSRPIPAAIFCLGSVGCLCVLWVTYLCYAGHHGFPWTLWLGGIYWYWGTWFAGKCLFKRGVAYKKALRPRYQGNSFADENAGKSHQWKSELADSRFETANDTQRIAVEPTRHRPHPRIRSLDIFGPVAQRLEQRTFTGRRRGNVPLVRCKFGERPVSQDDPTPSQARATSAVRCRGHNHPPKSRSRGTW
jgi:hypothetical protein